MPEDIGENLVGSYLRYIERCQFVVYNTQYPGVQGEIDVVGMRLAADRREVWFCEVVTHIRGTLYGDYDTTLRKLDEKLRRARAFAVSMFPDDRHYFEIWSPVVPVGKMTARFREMEQRYNDDALDLRFIVNEQYAERIQRLIKHARLDTTATSEPAYRLLQVLTRLRGTLTL